MNSVALIHDLCFQEHKMPSGHPETPKRLASLEKLFAPEGLFCHLPNLPFEAVKAEDLVLVHTPQHIERMAKTAGKEHVQVDADTSTSPFSFEVALKACGASRKIVDCVMQGEFQKAFALVRPPGHHAESGRAMGFCLFNNIAFAAAYARKQYGLHRLLILDWDVHHGNGTQEIFWEDEQIFYISTHRFPFYPGTGNYLEIGAGKGRGFTVNIPLPPGLGDLDFQEIFEKIIVPVGRSFKPELILISAGYDAYIHDPLGGECLSENGFAQLTRLMMDLAGETCDGKVVLLLEGGYHLEGLRHCVAATIETLLGQRQGAAIAGSALSVTSRILEKIQEIHGERWSIPKLF